MPSPLDSDPGQTSKIASKGCVEPALHVQLQHDGASNTLSATIRIGGF